jgi:hypothetical protein
MSDPRGRREAAIADAERVQRYWPGQAAEDTKPRIFMLSPDGWEESLEYYERRSGEPFDPAWAAKATEIAPGVRVFLLSTGGGSFGPEGQVCHFGARIAVWDDRRGSDHA